jgi:hypothetical protein
MKRTLLAVIIIFACVWAHPVVRAAGVPLSTPPVSTPVATGQPAETPPFTVPPIVAPPVTLPEQADGSGHLSPDSIRATPAIPAIPQPGGAAIPAVPAIPPTPDIPDHPADSLGLAANLVQVSDTGLVSLESQSLQFAITGIQTIPEPSSLLLVGLGLLGIGFCARRTRRES